MAEDTFWSRWEKQVRSIPQLKNLHQPDIGRSYPLPAYDDNGVQVRHFYNRASQIGATKLLLGPPLICASLSYSDGSLLGVVPAPELGMQPFEETTYTVPVEKQEVIRALVNEVRRLYDPLMSLFPHEPGGSVGQEFWEAFTQVVPPILLPYYELLSPDFVEWCTNRLTYR